MSLGGISGLGPSSGNNQGSGANASGESAGKEFSLEKQQAGRASGLGTADQLKRTRTKTTQIIDRKTRNRKGAPRTIIVDGEIYEVFLLAIA
jgi:hypothetical protein